jgi:hypothetical protein
MNEHRMHQFASFNTAARRRRVRLARRRVAALRSQLAQSLTEPEPARGSETAQR